jgi:hypothetical protein
MGSEKVTETAQAADATMPKDKDELAIRLAEMKERVRWAADVASEAGDFKEIAFAKVLDRLFQETVSSTPGLVRIGHSSPSETVPKRRSNGAASHRAPKADAAALERIKPIREAPPEITSELATKIAQVPPKVQIYAILDFAAEKFGITRLTTPEIREILRQVLRIGMPDGTLRGLLSKALLAEIGRVQNDAGETEYQLMLGGKQVLETAFAPGGSPVAPKD